MENMWAPWRLEYISGNDDKTNGCIFCELPKQNDDRKNYIVYRSSKCYVILNKYPYNNGHIMIVPYLHTNDLLLLDEKTQKDCQKTINLAVQALRQVYNPHAMNMGMNMGRTAGAGIEEHLHYHLLPRWDGDTNFMPVIAGTKVISESLRATCDKLTKAFKQLSEK